MSSTTPAADPAREGEYQGTSKGPSRTKSSRLTVASLKRSASKAMESKEVQSGTKFFSAYAKAWIGMSPIWLMGEAVTGRKVGGQFKKGTKEMVAAAEELRGILSDSAKDVIVIVDETLRKHKEETTKTAEVLMAAGGDAIVVVSTSLAESKSQFERNAPQLKHAVIKNSKDVVIIIDKALKHPVVVTGITKFAKSRGIPHSAAILTVACLGLAKVVTALEKAEAEAREDLAKVESVAGDDLVFVDAIDLENSTPDAASKQATEIGKAASGDVPEVKTNHASTSAEGGKKSKDGCIIM